jgi:diguanylate cyclase (GGDEF)-like protein
VGLLSARAVLPALPAGAHRYRALKEADPRSDAVLVERSAAGAARRRRLRVGGKFTLAIGVLVLALVAIAATGWAGLARSDRQLDQVYTDNLQALSRAFELVDVLHESELTALQLVHTHDPETEAQLDRDLDESLGSAVRAVQDMRELFSDDDGADVVLDEVDAGLARITALRRTGAYGVAGPQADDPAASQQLTQQTLALFQPLTLAVDGMHREEKTEAAVWRRQASQDEAATRRQLAVSVVVSLLGGVVIVLLLHRDVVPRIRRYADFATAIAGGRTAQPLHVRGSDELAELGLALNAMVAQRVRLQAQEHEQMEFVDTLQMTSSEDEAHDLIKRHTERSLPGSTAVVLQTNNSANRLQAATALPPDSPISSRLLGAEPRACLAVRFARTHQERDGVAPLLGCGVCGGLERPSTCEPLLVGGAVIGAVLVEQPSTAGGPTDERDHRIKTTVAQAAPVLANLRNLAVAELRANSDSLTGLPNRRATDDTLKRLVARANRSLAPLTAVIVDLDHFKQINDRFGHASGDEVLAAVGAFLTACLRESDFAGRFGGEEFLVLLPDTDTDGAFLVAEKIRTTVSSIRVPGVERDITASAGVADLLAHGGTATSMLREADRALYAAKADGRNRTVVATPAATNPPGANPAGATQPAG